MMEGRFRPAVHGDPAGKPTVNFYANLRKAQQVSNSSCCWKDCIVDGMGITEEIMGGKKDSC